MTRHRDRDQRITRAAEAIRDGASNRLAAQIAGINESTFYEWWRHSDPDISKPLHDAAAEFEMRMVKQATRDTPMAGPANSQWWLERRRRDEYGRKDSVENSGEVRITIVRE